MFLSNVKNQITSKVGLKLLEAQRHSPAVLFGVGAVGMIATVAVSCRATLKLDEVLKESEAKNLEIQESIGKPTKDGGEYTEADAKHDKKLNRVHLAVKIAKLYGPAIAIGAVTIAAMTSSHVILNRRYVGASAALATVDKAFKEYRARVVSELGEEKDRDFRYGTVVRDVVVDDETGTHVETITDRDPEGRLSQYAVLFDRDSSSSWKREPGYNSLFIKCQQNFANDRLQGIGYIFLNDVLRMLGMEPTSAGQAVGWMKGHGDDFVDFGIFRDVSKGDEFVSGNDSSMWLDFNVDGEIWTLLDEVKKEKKRQLERDNAKKANADAKRAKRDRLSDAFHPEMRRILEED